MTEIFKTADPAELRAEEALGCQRSVKNVSFRFLD